jgi:hypothetical protein
MEWNPCTPVSVKSPAALRIWCLLAGLALAPMPALFAAPDTVIYFLFESPLPIWTRVTMREPYWFIILGLPITMIFLFWALPGVGRAGLPPRSIVVLWVMAAYNPLRYYFETHFYGEGIARVAESYTWDSPLPWAIRHLDTPLLIGLVAVTLVRKQSLKPPNKLLFHWGLFVCALWAAGHVYESFFTEILLFRTFGI